MNRWYYIAGIFALAFLFNCSGRDAEKYQPPASERWVFEGWACPPDLEKAKQGLSPAAYCADEGPHEYLYLKTFVRASESAIQSGSADRKQISCRRAAHESISGTGYAKIIADYVAMADGPEIDYAAITKEIIDSTQDQISDIDIYDCCAVNQQTGRCANPEAGDAIDWADCMCVGYMKYPGGQNAFEMTAREY